MFCAAPAERTGWGLLYFLEMLAYISVPKFTLASLRRPAKGI
jgi:hypothetical protein